jgi:hypothetical protein
VKRHPGIDHGTERGDPVVVARDECAVVGDEMSDVRSDDVEPQGRPVVPVLGQEGADRRGVLRGRGADLERAMTSSSRSWSSAWAVIPSRPVMVRAASKAFTIAASVASTAAWNSGVIARSTTIRASTVSRSSCSPAVRDRPRLPVAKAITRSPESCAAMPPIRPMPKPARCASRSH